MSAILGASTETTSPHGSLGRYNNHRCRCQDCRRANTEHQRGFRRRQADLRREAQARGEVYVASITCHGVTGWCTYSCRCDEDGRPLLAGAR